MEPTFPLREALCAVGRDFYQRGWVLATSGNFSAVVTSDPWQLLITASGKHKGRLHADDFLLLDRDGRPEPSTLKPSAETALHLLLTRQPGIGAVLHTHSVWSTVLSGRFCDQGGLW